MGRLSFDGGRTFIELKDMTFDEFDLMERSISRSEAKEKIKELSDYITKNVQESEEWKEFQKTEHADMSTNEWKEIVRKFGYHVMQKYEGDIILNNNVLYNLRVDGNLAMVDNTIDGYEYIFDYDPWEGCDVNLTVELVTKKLV